jgi:fermentation-respiration switch protein FrsA (DUF1100 family)
MSKEHSKEKIERTKVSFESDGVELVSYLHHPSHATGRGPCVVMGHGFSGTQDRLFDNAGRFAEAGLAALTFDYRSFGESGGEPRQLVSVEGQLEDWRAAIRCARGLEGVDPDRIALWGSSLGGGHVIVVAAEDPRIAAVVAQIPFNGFPRRVEGRSTLDTLKLIWAMTVDAVRGRLGLSPHYIPMVGKPGEVAVTATPRSQQHIANAVRGDPGLTVAQRGRPTSTLWHVAVSTRRRGASARDAGAGVRRRTRQRDPRGAYAADSRAGAARELRRYPGDHFDFYRDPVRQQVLTDQIAFLHEHLTVLR